MLEIAVCLAVALTGTVIRIWRLCLSAEGEYIQQDGSIVRSGRGIHTTKDGSVYDGEWSEDKMNGTGTLTHHSGAYYTGEFVNNQFHGHGKYTWPNGSSYEGEFVENK